MEKPSQSSQSLPWPQNSVNKTSITTLKWHIVVWDVYPQRHMTKLDSSEPFEEQPALWLSHRTVMVVRTSAESQSRSPRLSWFWYEPWGLSVCVARCPRDGWALLFVSETLFLCGKTDHRKPWRPAVFCPLCAQVSQTPFGAAKNMILVETCFLYTTLTSFRADGNWKNVRWKR